MSYKYKTGEYYGSTCHIFEFNPKEIKFDVTIGVKGKLEPLSKIEHPDKKKEQNAIAKINGGFFAMNGKAEFIGTFVESGLFYSLAAQMYPTAVFTKDYKLILDQHPSQDQLAKYQSSAFWAIGCPWLLVKDGKVNYLYPKNELIATFGHPWQKAPRTMMGQKKDGTIVWVVVDGRKRRSPGYTIVNQSSLMVDLGCDIAFNLDGGGSSEMIIDNKIVNTPSDGRERYIGTAFIAYETPVSGPTVCTISARNSLLIRKGPSTDTPRIGTIKFGETATLWNSGKMENGFCKITYKGIEGYCYRPFLTF